MSTENSAISLLKGLPDAIHQALWYFQFFNHALDLKELRLFLNCRVSAEQLKKALNQEVGRGVLLEQDGFYALDSESLQKRIEHQQLNRKWLKIARRMSRLIAAFPFVRAVYLSGSLSKKGLNGEDDDIDYFLITRANRVWTAKFLLMGFKKIFLLNSKRYFCINLLRDEGHLQFERQNIYIATELVSLKVLNNPSYLYRLYEANPWVFDFFPNVEVPKAEEASARLSLLEKAVDFFLGDSFENWCRKQFQAHVDRQQSKRNSHFETSPHSSAFFPNNFQEKVLEHYKTKTNLS